MRWFKRRQKYEEIDIWDFLRRAQAIQVQMGRVKDRGVKAASCLDFEALEAAQREGELLLDNMREIRLEQLEAERNGYRKPISTGDDPR